MSVPPRLSLRGQQNVDKIMPKIKAAVAEREKPGNTNIDLSTAENELIREELLEICKGSIDKSLERRHFSYPKGFSGDPELISALAAFFNRYFSPQKPVESSHITTAPGASAQLDALLYNICDPGEGVLIPAPYWNGFDFQFTVRSSATLIPVVVESNFTGGLTTALISSLENAIKTAEVSVKALVLTNPHNPLSLYYPKETLEACVKFCESHGIHYISDEVYAMSKMAGKLTDTAPFVSALSLDAAALGVDPSRIHVVWSISKDLGSSGMRLGCAVTQHNQELLVGLALAANTQTSSLTAIYTTAILTSPKLDELFALNSTRIGTGYDIICGVLKRNQIEYIPVSAGNFIFAKLVPDAKTWEEETDMIAKLKEAGVLVSPGKAYHGQESEKGWARITFTVHPDTLREGLRRLETVLNDARRPCSGKRSSDRLDDASFDCHQRETKLVATAAVN